MTHHTHGCVVNSPNNRTYGVRVGCDGDIFFTTSVTTRVTKTEVFEKKNDDVKIKYNKEKTDTLRVTSDDVKI
jgi:hypothetical protein